MCKYPELVKSVVAAWGTGAQVNLTGLKLTYDVYINLLINNTSCLKFDQQYY